MKFRRGLYEAFVFFDANRNGQLSLYEWIHGLHALNVDSLTQEEIEAVFHYLDAEKKGEIGLD